MQHLLYDQITMSKRGHVWQYRWFVKSDISSSGTGKDFRKSSGKTDFKEACIVAGKAYEEFLLTIGKGEKVNLGGRVSLNDCFELAEKRYRVLIGQGQIVQSTWNSIAEKYEREIQPHLGKVAVADIDSRMWKDFLAGLYTRKPHLSKNYVRLIKVSLQTCLKYADELVDGYRLPKLVDGMKFGNKGAKRIWFGIREQQMLIQALEENIAAKTRKSDLYAAQQLRDRVHFMLYTGLRPDELKLIRCKDVKLKGVRDHKANSRYRVTIITVPGGAGAKTGGRTTIGVRGSGDAYNRVLTRRGLDKHSDLVLFDQDNRSKFTEILDQLGIRGDKKGEYRTFESLRHSFISNRFLENQDVNEIAKNCGNSPKVIEEHYTNHITPLDFEEYKKFQKLQKLKKAQALANHYADGRPPGS